VTGQARLADWLQGWGTVAGAIFSGLAAVATFALLLHEVRLRRFERRETEIAQARSVFVVLEDPEAGWQGDTVVQPTFTLRNLSSNVISDVWVEVHLRDGSGSTSASADHLAAGERLVLPWGDPSPIPWPAQLSPPDLFDISTSFTDAAGIRWERLGRRQPTRPRSHTHSDFLPSIRPQPDLPPTKSPMSAKSSHTQTRAVLSRPVPGPPEAQAGPPR
jgi:hypothetical protein